MDIITCVYDQTVYTLYYVFRSGCPTEDNLCNSQRCDGQLHGDCGFQFLVD